MRIKKLKAEITTIRKDLTTSKKNVSALIGIYARQETQLKDLRNKMLQSEASENKLNLLIYGIKVHNGENIVEVVQHFFQNQMGIATEIPMSNAF